VREICQHTLRIQKVLEDANIKLASVLSEILGKSGRAMLEAIIAGQDDPDHLADLARGTAKQKRALLIEALRGRTTGHHRQMLRLHLSIVDALECALDELDLAAEKALTPIHASVENLKTMPGVSDVVAHVIIAEIGVDMSRFPSAAHLISWAKLSPRNDESAGKRRSTRVLKGANWLKPTLVNAAWAAVRKKDSYLQSQYLRLKSRRGPKKAILAVAASMLTASYYILRDGVPYKDLGPHHFTRRDKTKTIRRLVARLNDLGCEVQVKPLVA
jgi:transposase